MTIKPGQAWGEPATLPDDAVIARGDREISMALDAARRDGHDFPTFGVLGGDLCRTVAGTGRLTTAFPVDVGEVLVDGVLHHFVAHLVARRSWWRGPIVVVMNAQHLGRWNVAPRSHPNDGRVDVFEADLSIGDRWKAWRRLPTGTHVPHPGIRQERTSGRQFDLDRGMRVWLDGRDLGPARSLSVRCVADALTVVV